MKLCVLVAVAISVVAACKPSPPPPAPIPVVVGDGGVDLCDLAWRRLEQLGCEEAASPEGVTFAKTCHDVADAGVDLHPACVSQTPSCDDVSARSRGEGCP